MATEVTVPLSSVQWAGQPSRRSEGTLILVLPNLTNHSPFMHYKSRLLAMETHISWLLLTLSSLLQFPVSLGELLVPLAHLQTLASQMEHPALTIMKQTHLCGDGLCCSGLLEAELGERPGARGHSQQSRGSAHAGEPTGPWGYCTICWLAVCILKHNLKADISEFRLFPVSRSISSMSRSLTVIFWNAGMFFHSLLVDVRALKSRCSIVLYKALLFIFSFQKRNVRGI